MIEHNLIGTINLLEAAARWQAGVVLLSTSRVYSIPVLASLPLAETENDRGPCFAIDATKPLPPGISPAGITEDFSTAAPVSLYGATKLASETLAMEYAHRSGTPLFINRCGVMAGAGQFGKADQGIFSWWIRQWIAKGRLSYIGFGGRGLQVRDCLHPDDLTALILLQMRSSLGTEPAVWNVSGGAVVIMMADESDDCRDVVRYWNALNEGSDCVFGSRFMKGGGTIDYPWLKWCLNRLANFFIRVLFRIRLNDTTNAFKAYRREVIKGCMPILSPHFNITVELPLKAIVRGYSWTVIPITWRNRRSGMAKLKIREMGSRYFFIVAYVWLEKYFSSGDYRRTSR